MSTGHWPLPFRSAVGVAETKGSSKHSQASSIAPAGVSKPAWAVMAVCSFVGMLTSSYLAWVSLTSSPIVGCGDGSVFDCEHVLHSQWSTVLSIPVSVPAVATHLSILGLLLARSTRIQFERIRWQIIVLLALVAGAAGVWFVGLQVFWLQHLCPYCMVAHICGILLAATVLWKQPVDSSSLRLLGALAVAMLIGFVSLQSLNEIPQTYKVITHSTADTSPLFAPASDAEPAIFAAPDQATEGIDDGPTNAVSHGDDEATLFDSPKSADVNRTDPLGFLPINLNRWTAAESLPLMISAFFNPSVLLHGQVASQLPKATADERPSHQVRVLNNLKLNTYDWPLVGKPDAELIFVELFDYTCPHCQRTHLAIERARQKYGDRLAVLTLPVPMDRQCNPTVLSTHSKHAEACAIAKLAVAVWTVAPIQFAEFHHYLFTTKPRYQQATEKASQMIGSQNLQQAMQSKIPGDYISKHVALYQKAGGGTIPKLMFPETTVVGAIESETALASLIEQHLVGATGRQ